MAIAARRLVQSAAVARRRWPIGCSARLAHTAAPVQFDLAAIRAEVEAEHARQQSELVVTAQLQGVHEASYAQPAAPWHWLDRELSSNIAGETGAVCIYHGAAAALRGNAALLVSKL